MVSNSIDTVELILDNITYSNDNWGGWLEYHEDIAVYKERIRTILTEWEELCKSKVND